MSVVSVSMPEELLEQIDGLVDEHGYSGRSEVIRDAGRKLVGEFEDVQLEGEQLAAVISVLYPYDSPDIESGLTRLRHEHNGKITSNSHSCIGDDDCCLETFVVEGRLGDVSTFVRDIETVSERIRVDHTLYRIDGTGDLHFQP